ncbi:ABC transporter ATP-binding protein [Bacillus sp. EAC]|uniref:ABC transporter ATP-binding protein n=1 Tax=Bacillus sp. EAC TaxID=1978338 RepID=UPI000B447F8F|nr:ABC transporter ATP-binding protein [Bacillus sp. EAC]
MMSDVVQIHQVDRLFGKKAVLKNISIKIGEGEIFGILGPSGSGKTTLIKLIAGIDKCSNGEVLVYGKEMPNFSVLSSIGYMGQSDALYTDLTGFDNLSFFGALYNLKGEGLKTRIQNVAKIVGLEDSLNKHVNQYSGGMKKRLSLAIAILHKPTLLILDEPTVGIDPVLRKQIWKQFSEMKEQGTTIIITTHIMEEAEKCERIALIREGELIALDTTENLISISENGKIEDLYFKNEVSS